MLGNVGARGSNKRAQNMVGTIAVKTVTEIMVKCDKQLHPALGVFDAYVMSPKTHVQSENPGS